MGRLVADANRAVTNSCGDGLDLRHYQLRDLRSPTVKDTPFETASGKREGGREEEDEDAGNATQEQQASLLLPHARAHTGSAPRSPLPPRADVGNAAHDLQASAAWESVIAKAAERAKGERGGGGEGERGGGEGERGEGERDAEAEAEAEADVWSTVSPAPPSEQPAPQRATASPPSLDFPSPASNATLRTQL
jgi:hypothetical protein